MDVSNSRIRVSCPQCQAKYLVGEGKLGGKVLCPRCSTSFVLSRTGPHFPPMRRSASSSDDAVPVVWKPGDVILGLYEVKGVLGEGGMGTVYHVHHRGWGEELAVKSPKPEIFKKKDGPEEFVREVQTWINLGQHPHIVTCYFIQVLGGIPRVFAELVGGGSLSTWIRTGSLYVGGVKRSLERILDVAIQMAWGLHYAHERGLVHQDVKPDNVLMTPGGMAKITDFGLAKAGVNARLAHISGSRQDPMVSVGGMTPAYCSPEQAARRQIACHTDTWSWGLSVLEMFLGERTWMAGPVAREALKAAADPTSTDPEHPIPSMPDRVLQVLQTCFEEDPGKRPSIAAEIIPALRLAYEENAGLPHLLEDPHRAPLSGEAWVNNHAVTLAGLRQIQKAADMWSEAAKQTTIMGVAPTYNHELLRLRLGISTHADAIARMSSHESLGDEEWKRAICLAWLHLEHQDKDTALRALSAFRSPSDCKYEHGSVKWPKALERWTHTQITGGQGAHPTDEARGFCAPWFIEPPQRLRLHILASSDIGEVRCIRLVGSVFNECIPEVDPIITWFRAQIDRGAKHLIIDLSALRGIRRAAAGNIIIAVHSAQGDAEGGLLILVGAPPAFTEGVEQLGLGNCAKHVSSIRDAFDLIQSGAVCTCLLCSNVGRA